MYYNNIYIYVARGSSNPYIRVHTGVRPCFRDVMRFHGFLSSGVAFYASPLLHVQTSIVTKSRSLTLSAILAHAISLVSLAHKFRRATQLSKTSSMASFGSIGAEAKEPFLCSPWLAYACSLLVLATHLFSMMPRTLLTAPAMARSWPLSVRKPATSAWRSLDNGFLAPTFGFREAKAFWKCIWAAVHCLASLCVQLVYDCVSPWRGWFP